MFRLAMAVMAVCLLAGPASAQLFPNAPWNKGRASQALDCANGQCQMPTVVPQVAATSSYSQSSYATSVGPNYVQSGGSTGSAGGYGSSGSSLPVGVLDAQGYSIAPAVPTVSPAIAGVAVESLAMSDRTAFRRALLAAARQARDSGDITSMEFFVLSAASRSPRVLEKMQAAVHEAAIEEGLASAQAVNWDSLIMFIEKLIPLITKLIDLFS